LGELGSIYQKTPAILAEARSIGHGLESDQAPPMFAEDLPVWRGCDGSPGCIPHLKYRQKRQPGTHALPAL